MLQEDSRQITGDNETKDYADKYKDRNKPISLMGIEFNSKVKNVVTLEWEEL